ncbi:uncharacterized protein F54H12.2-like [Ptychodera flava]|uniref:uncharacterized protein F54H12.2-like n=1 Tax=Ptychodera flava TaxID=63121 RepID=UPI00396A54E1
MAFNEVVDKASCVCTKSELDLFSVPPTQTSILESRTVQFNPISTLAEGSPIEFVVAGSPSEYIDLPMTRLFIKAKITAADGSNLPAAAQVAPVNLLLHSLFSQLEVSLNGKVVSSSNNTYAYRSYIETLLNYSNEAKSTHLTSALFYKDTPGKFDSANPLTEEGGNQGLKKRHSFTSQSKTVDLFGPIHSDIFFQNRLLLNGVDLKLKLTRGKNDFCLMSSQPANGYKIQILEASLHVRRVKVAPFIIESHARALELSPAKYPISRVECKSYAVTPGHLTFTKENVFLDPLPRRLIIGFIESNAFSGSYEKNPYNFETQNINYLAVFRNSELITGKPLTPKFSVQGGRNYIRAYETLFSGTDIFTGDKGHNLDRDDFVGGNCLFAFNLTPDLSTGGEHFNIVDSGTLSIEVHFDIALQETVNLIVYAEFDNIIQIDKPQNIITDYSR